ncbi:MAG: HAD hydrolase family protein [Proteobacteria bacterium]|nr:HAD hydrolase family protein [Pseudomonadota bacterium]
MGKPYQEELARLPSTTVEAFAVSIDRLRHAVEDNGADGLVIVASGGSHSVALYLAQLHQEAVGHACCVVTPLVFRSSPAFSQGAVWLLSAGGRNSDILDAARHAIASGAKAITALIAAHNTPLEQLLAPNGSSRTIAFSLSAGKDGFLATNSLWASCLLLDRAYRAAFGAAPLEPNAVKELLTWARDAVATVPVGDGDIVGVGDPDTMIGLADLEMRSTEAALAHVWVSDLRNLAHGRHYWFATHGATTTALCLVTAPFQALANATMGLIKEASPAIIVAVPGVDSAARLGSIAFSLYLAQRLGLRSGRDPGRPGVPTFGEALYNLVVPTPALKPEPDQERLIIQAKLGRPTAVFEDSERDYWKGHLQAFRQRLAASRIPGVVFDFDGTLIQSSRRYEPMDRTVVSELCRLLDAGVHVGIATGRGDSCGEELRRHIPLEQMAGVTIGYHNGATILPLSTIDLPSEAVDPAIVEAKLRIERDVLRPGRGRCRIYPRQCSASFLDGRGLSEAWAQVSAALRDLIDAGHLKVWESSHSIDVISANVSKQSVVSFVASQANCLPEEILCFGDRGRWPGNDTELLDHPLSLSADQCSAVPDRCWNLAGAGRRQVAATCYQLQLFDAADGILRFREATE